MISTLLFATTLSVYTSGMPEATPVIDTQPETRLQAEELFTDKFDIAKARLTNASRFHFEFELGKSDIQEPFQSVLTQYSASLKPAVILVAGYTDYQGTESLNLMLSEDRSWKVATLLQEKFPSAQVIVDASIHWGGSQEAARRVDAFFLSQP